MILDYLTILEVEKDLEAIKKTVRELRKKNLSHIELKFIYKKIVVIIKRLVTNWKCL